MFACVQEARNAIKNKLKRARRRGPADLACVLAEQLCPAEAVFLEMQHLVGVFNGELLCARAADCRCRDA